MTATFTTSAAARAYALEKDREADSLLCQADSAEIAIEMEREPIGAPADLRAAAAAAMAECDRADRIADELAADEAETARYGA